ncbi:Gag-Pol polyprotein-like Protein [Tribolium castaneum]|uniref:Gag-Pol polyprotein-like Protein n=1 Tax=Tribolium castaneum TaxID=7070 RepID=A0A139W8L4_TRICA|nr:Gag-Pol polyprotein-like Protein [Tribolium castaneum]
MADELRTAKSAERLAKDLKAPCSTSQNQHRFSKSEGRCFKPKEPDSSTESRTEVNRALLSENVQKVVQVSSTTQAGRLKDFASKWCEITNNQVILNWIKGYTIPFQHQPRQAKRLVNQKFSNTESKTIIECLQALMTQGAVKKCIPTSNQFISPFFLVKKPNGSERFILNLKHLNRFLKPPHFKMEDSRTVTKLIKENIFMATIDLKDAYFLLPIRKSDRKYIRFKFREQLYEFTCMPFGLSTAPYAFTKLMKPVTSFLRIHNIVCVVYLDDFLIFGKSEQSCQNNVKTVITLLQNLGFIINFEKSNCQPSQRCKFLGFVFDSVKMRISLPREKWIGQTHPLADSLTLMAGIVSGKRINKEVSQKKQ